MTTLPAQLQRFVGRFRGAQSGPTLMAVAGVHGNEPAGVHAMHRVLTRLRAERYPVRGEVACVIGNLGALKRGVRYRSKDLNRAWSDERVAALRAGTLPMPWDDEDVEQVGLFQALEQVRRTARGPLTMLDLHTTSGSGAPFTTIANTPESHAFANSFPLTCLTGLVEGLSGTMLVALAGMDVAGLLVECGQNEEAASVEHAEAALWIGLVSAGLLDDADVSQLPDCVRLLETARGALPLAIRVVYRHGVVPEDQFKMELGFRQFERVAKGQLLARDVRGDVLCPDDGYLLMPLYQGLGSDGFFLGKGA